MTTDPLETLLLSADASAGAPAPVRDDLAARVVRVVRWRPAA